jgi:hypothetical protein
LAPARRHCLAYDDSSWSLSTKMAKLGSSASKSLMSETPLPFFEATPTTTACGFAMPTAVNAANPQSDPPQTTKSVSRSIRWLRPYRVSGWSSTRNTRYLVFFDFTTQKPSGSPDNAQSVTLIRLSRFNYREWSSSRRQTHCKTHANTLAESVKSGVYPSAVGSSLGEAAGHYLLGSGHRRDDARGGDGIQLVPKAMGTYAAANEIGFPHLIERTLDRPCARLARSCVSVRSVAIGAIRCSRLRPQCNGIRSVHDHDGDPNPD